MYLGYQQGKIKFYTEKPLDKALYKLDEIIETQAEYVLDGEEYVLNDETYKEKQKQKELARINSLTLDSSTFYKEVLRTSGKTVSDIQYLIQYNNILSSTQKESLLIDLQKTFTFVRGSFFITTIGTLLNYTTEDLNYLFENKVFSY